MTQPEATDPVAEAIDRVLLEIKALALLGVPDDVLARRLRERVLGSHDADVKRFITFLEPARPSRPWGQILIGTGELVLAAFLTLAGFVTIIPSILGLGSPADVRRYFGDLFDGLSATGLADPVIVTMSFALGVFLFLAAFYTLRQASPRLRSAGVIGAH